MNTVLSEIELMTATNGAVKGFYEPYPTIAKLSERGGFQCAEQNRSVLKTQPTRLL